MSPPCSAQPGRRPNPGSNSVSAPLEACDLGQLLSLRLSFLVSVGEGGTLGHGPPLTPFRSASSVSRPAQSEGAAARTLPTPGRRPQHPPRPLPHPWEGISLPLQPHRHPQQGTCRFRCHVSLLFPAEDRRQSTGLFPGTLAEPTRTQPKACRGARPGPRCPAVALAPGRVRAGRGWGWARPLCPDISP